MNRNLSIVRIGLLVLLGGCAATRNVVGPRDRKPPWDSSPVQTDSLVYHLRRTPDQYSATVAAVYRNTSSAPISYARCNGSSTGPMFGLRRTGADSTRRFYTDWSWACVGSVPTGTIQPGDSLVVHVRVGSVDQKTMQPPLQPGDLIGDLRVQFYLCDRFVSNSDDCSYSSQASSSSNAFNVRYE